VIAATIGEFDDAARFVEAARELVALRYNHVETYGPYAVPELDEVLGIRRTKLRWAVLATGLGGAGLAWFIQRWCNAVDYPYLVGGRPYDSAPTHVPIMFETAVLLAGATAFLGMLLLCRLPRLASPILDVPGFERTSVDRFWIVVRYPESEWAEALPQQLASMGAVAVRKVGEAP
jgi:hypothetical protein